MLSVQCHWRSVHQGQLLRRDPQGAQDGDAIDLLAVLQIERQHVAGAALCRL